jgi:cytochrome c oxidase cbb3-type subunit 1
MSELNEQLEHPVYNYNVVRQFAVMTVVWGIVGMLVGVIIAAQLVWPDLSFEQPWFSFGRLRPLHTNAVIFAFGGSALFATSYYVVQRTTQARLISDGLAAFTFWGWQLVILLAAISLPLGYTSSKEYAELIWPNLLRNYECPFMSFNNCSYFHFNSCINKISKQAAEVTDFLAFKFCC